MEGSNKRQLSPQAGTSGKKAKGPYDPRNEAVAPTKKQPHKPDARPTTQGDSDSESDARDQSYLEGVKNAEINFDFELALDEENIQEAMAMATTEEQRERAKKAAEYIEKVGRISNNCSQLLGKQLSNTHMHICLQVKRTRKSLSDPKNKPKVNFWGTPRTRAAAAAAQAYSSQVSRRLRLAKRITVTPPNHFLHSLQLKTARAIVKEMDKNNNATDALKSAAAKDAAEASKQGRTSGFTPPGAKSTPKGPSSKPKVSPQFKPGPPQ